MHYHPSVSSKVNVRGAEHSKTVPEWSLLDLPLQEKQNFKNRVLLLKKKGSIISVEQTYYIHVYLLTLKYFGLQDYFINSNAN